MIERKITEHEGKKYLRTITSCLTGESIQVDVYDVLEAFGVTCQAQGHAIKKLLTPGQRGKGSVEADLHGAMAALCRAMELLRNREKAKEKKDA